MNCLQTRGYMLSLSTAATCTTHSIKQPCCTGNARYALCCKGGNVRRLWTKGAITVPLRVHTWTIPWWEWWGQRMVHTALVASVCVWGVSTANWTLLIWCARTQWRIVLNTTTTVSFRCAIRCCIQSRGSSSRLWCKTNLIRYLWLDVCCFGQTVKAIACKVAQYAVYAQPLIQCIRNRQNRMPQTPACVNDTKALPQCWGWIFPRATTSFFPSSAEFPDFFFIFLVGRHPDNQYMHHREMKLVTVQHLRWQTFLSLETSART